MPSPGPYGALHMTRSLGKGVAPNIFSKYGFFNHNIYIF
jgi:hypothetical protein